MKQAPLPEDENQRLRALNHYNILDSLPESDFDDITKIAAEICHTPIALVSFVDADRQWFKSHYGLQTRETSRDYSFCAHAILNPQQITVVPDSSQDERFADNPLATGEPHVVFYAGAPLITPEGHPLGTLCVIDNMPRNLNQQQQEALKALAHQVMTQLELRKKVREMEIITHRLEKTNEALSRFAHICSHDMKAPLFNITSLTNTLQEKYSGHLDPLGRKYVEHINTSAERLRCLVDDVLSYSKIPELVSQDTQEVDLNQLFKEICELLTIPDNVTVAYSQDLPVIQSYKVALQQILQNLLSNAIKYNDKEKGFIQIAMAETATHWKFTVEDNGPGIDPKDQEKIFEVFHTLGIRDRYGKLGSGVGLSTVKSLVEELGGHLTLSSVLGKGCLFTFTLKK